MPRAIDAGRVDAAIDKAVAFILAQQGRDGLWRDAAFDRVQPGALTPLCLLTIRSAGAMAPGRRINRSLRLLTNPMPTATVRTRALALSAMCAVDPVYFKSRIAEEVHALTLRQDAGGAWGHGGLARAAADTPRLNHADTQAALVALDGAARVGVTVSASVWRRAERAWLSGQNADGGWGFGAAGVDAGGGSGVDAGGEGRSASAVAMTAAGLASLQLIYDRLYLQAELPFNGRFKGRCGVDVETSRPIRRALTRGRDWLDAHFRAGAWPTADRDAAAPGAAPHGDAEAHDAPRVRDTASAPETASARATAPQHAAAFGYGKDDKPGDVRTPAPWRWVSRTDAMYSVCRAGASSGLKRFGGRAWFGDVASRLIGTQRDDGSWGGVADTCFGVLALVTGRDPVLVNKLRYGGAQDGNNDPLDAAHLARWYGDRFGRAVSWQRVGLDGDDVYDAPVLLITGHAPPRLGDAERETLTSYVWSGGTILAVACCSKPTFTNESLSMFESLFPNLEARVVPDEHWIWSRPDAVKPGADVIGLSDGCRTRVFVLGNAACCAWHQDLHDKQTRLFRLGGNILHYATHDVPLRGRLSPYFDRPDTPPTRRVRVARLRHKRDWLTDPDALRHLSMRLAARIGLGVDEAPAVTADGVRRADVDIVWLTGHRFEPLRPDRRIELKSYLSAGGTLFASACCGRKAFDGPFRAFAAGLFGPDAWELIGQDDPIMTGTSLGAMAGSLRAPRFKHTTDGASAARMDRPMLYGIRRNGRWVLIYSPYDVHCGLTGHPCADCVGYVPHDARSIAANVLLYAAAGRNARK
ncbi:MAG: DUF4159 domain-containing protein [Phycisphaerae bacterium]